MTQLTLWEQEIAMGEIYRQLPTVQDTLERIDRRERRRGGRWQECARLGPGEEVIESPRLTTPKGKRRRSA